MANALLAIHDKKKEPDPDLSSHTSGKRLTPSLELSQGRSHASPADTHCFSRLKEVMDVDDDERKN